MIAQYSSPTVNDKPLAWNLRQFTRNNPAFARGDLHHQMARGLDSMMLFPQNVLAARNNDLVMKYVQFRPMHELLGQGMLQSRELDFVSEKTLEELKIHTPLNDSATAVLLYDQFVEDLNQIAQEMFAEAKTTKAPLTAERIRELEKEYNDRVMKGASHSYRDEPMSMLLWTNMLAQMEIEDVGTRGRIARDLFGMTEAAGEVLFKSIIRDAASRGQYPSNNQGRG